MISGFVLGLFVCVFQCLCFLCFFFDLLFVGQFFFLFLFVFFNHILLYCFLDASLFSNERERNSVKLGGWGKIWEEIEYSEYIV